MTAPGDSWFAREGLALLTDFYELTMIAGYIKERRANARVCFEYFFRNLPPHSGFAVAAGLEPFLHYLSNLRFHDDDLDYLRSLGKFDDDFFSYIKDFRPACTVRAIPEGTLVFPFEPLVQIEGSIVEAQLVETALLNFLNFQTLIATKAARICQAAEGEPVMEFGLRRAHGPDGGLSGSRAAFIGGCSSSSNVLAGKVYGVPVDGTHAHSWVMSFPDEIEAFRAFVRLYPDNPILLVDTYDTLESGVPNAITVFKELRAQGLDTRPSIRLDSGDLAKLSKLAHAMMCDAGFDDPLIVASNDLEEDLIADLKRQGAKINAWGVGTHLITSHDNPALNGVYKLVALEEDGVWLPRIKISSNVEKATDPGRKKLVRYYDAGGCPIGDVMYDAEEEWPDSGVIDARQRSQPHLAAQIRGAVRAEPLLQTVFENGAITVDLPPIADLRQRALDQINAIPDEFRRLRNPQIYNVLLSPRLAATKAELLYSHTPST
ncbi:MAG: nicotinate phosphoribosyltransferase [Candidatus Hydrogenedentes bacterium]|nr:nicotinate phosphoribosyltransferase [Candidatus Hydrogenedentota bacterium]